jgi:AcrR family transcriptional regulator
VSPTSRRRSTRDRPAKAPLSEQAVVDAALEILRAEGLEAVTMRRVAAALDTGAGSLYVWVAGRDGLLQAIQDRVTAGVELEAPDPARWRPQLHALLERLRDALMAHPGIAEAMLAELPRSEVALTFVENLLGVLLAGGLDPQDAAWGTDVLSQLVTHAAIESDVQHSTGDDFAASIHLRLDQLPADRFPLLTAYADQMVAGDADQRFHYAIDVVLDGMLARARSTG